MRVRVPGSVEGRAETSQYAGRSPDPYRSIYTAPRLASDGDSPYAPIVGEQHEGAAAGVTQPTEPFRLPQVLRAQAEQAPDAVVIAAPDHAPMT